MNATETAYSITMKSPDLSETSEGFMKGCLQYQKGTDLRGLMRGGCTDSELKKAIYQVIWNKPVSHNFYEAKTEQDEIRGMSQIGG